MSKRQKFTHKDVEKEWRQAVKDRAIQQNVDEDSVIRWGLHHDFKKAKAEEEFKEKRLSLLTEIRDALREANK